MYLIEHFCCLLKTGATQFLFALALVIAGVLYFYPKVVIRIIQRWLIYRSGFKIKRIQLPDGFTFEYMEKGCRLSTTDSVLLVHGFSQSKDAMCPLGHCIPPDIHTIAIDLPGHGGSSRKLKNDSHLHGAVERIHEFVDAVGLKEEGFHILGHSLGGLLAGLYALKYSKHLKSLTLVACAGVKSPNPSTFEKEAATIGTALLVPETNEQFVQMMDKMLYKSRALPSIIVSGAMQIRQQYHQFYMEVIEKFHKDNAQHALTEYLQDIKIPTLVVWGQNDNVVDITCTDVIKEKIPSCKIETVECCGHIVPFEKPKRLASIFLNFLKSTKSYEYQVVKREGQTVEHYSG